MTKISAKIIADSRNEFGNRITTMVVTFPRYILAELNTHRMMSKNSASSRAIPFEKLMLSVTTNPFIPIAWMKDHKGMQGTEYFEEVPMIQELERQWLQSRSDAVSRAVDLSHKGLTKQLINRIMEPFMWHTVIITATEYSNFFALRCPKYIFHDHNGDDKEYQFRSRKDVIKHFGENETVDYSDENKVAFKDLSELDWLKLNKGQADIHMMTLAEAMYDAYQESTPKELKAGEWHIPFGDNLEDSKIFAAFENPSFVGDDSDIQKLKIKIATARCARISYTVVGEEGKPANYENDLKLHDRLAESGHWSPFEHCARAMNKDEMFVVDNFVTDFDGVSGNFRGFTQYRKSFNNENITK